MSEAAGSIVPGAHGPHVGVSAASQARAQDLSGRSAHDFFINNEEMKRNAKRWEEQYNRQRKLDDKTYKGLAKLHSGMNKNLEGLSKDSKVFWKSSSIEISKTMRELSKSLVKEMAGVTDVIEKNMDKMISLSMQRQKKADEAFRSAVKQGNQFSIRQAAYNSKNEGARLAHSIQYKKTHAELQSESRQKSIMEARMSRGETMTADDYREYERLTKSVVHLEEEMNKLALVNKYLAKGITDVAQAARAAELELEHMEKTAKTFDEMVSKAKVDLMESAKNTFTFAKAMEHAGNAAKLLYKDYNVFTEQLYKMNGAMDISQMSFGKMAKNAAVFQVTDIKLRVFAATANMTGEQYDQLKSKLEGAYMMMDKFGNYDSRKFEQRGREMMNYTRLTGASIDESVAFHHKLRAQFGQTDAQAAKTMRTVIAAQKEARAATSRSFADFATFNDDFQKSIQSIVDGYDGFKMDVAGVTSLFKEQVKVAEKLGATYEQSFDIAKRFAGLMTKKHSSKMDFDVGTRIEAQIADAFGGKDKLSSVAKMRIEDQGKFLDNFLQTSQGKALGLSKDELGSALTLLGDPTGAHALQIGRTLGQTKMGQRATISTLADYKRGGGGLGSQSAMMALLGMDASDPKFALMMRQVQAQLEGVKTDADVKNVVDTMLTTKDVDKNAPGADGNKFFNPGSYISGLMDFLNNSPLGSALKALGTAGAAMTVHTMAMGAHSLALLGSAGKGMIGGAATAVGGILSKIPGLRGLAGKMGGAGAGAMEGAVAKNGGRLAGLLAKFGGTKGKVIAGLLAGGATIYGGSKLFGGSSSTDAQSAESAVQATAEASDEQVEQQKKTNEHLEKIVKSMNGASSASQTSGSSLGSLLSNHPMLGIAGGAGAAGATYFALKKLLSRGASSVAAPNVASSLVSHADFLSNGSKLAAEGAAEASAKGAGKGLLAKFFGSAITKTVGAVIGPAISFAMTDGPTGRKTSAAAGTAIGTVLGGAAGSLLGPVGTFVGGALGGAAGEWIGTALYDSFSGFDPAKGNTPASQAARKGLSEQWANAVSPEGRTPEMDAMYNSFMAGNPLSTTASATTPTNSLGLPTSGATGGGTGTFINVGKDGAATLSATIRLDNFSPSMNTAFRDSYNMQNPNSGLSRRGYGNPASV